MGVGNMSKSVNALALSPQNEPMKFADYMDGIKTFYYSDPASYTIGDPYLDENFDKGEIYFYDSTVLVDIYLRYNVFQDKMEVLYEGDTFGIQPSYKIVGLKLGDRTFVNSLRYDEFTKQFDYGYFQELVDGKTLLLKRYEKTKTYSSFANNYTGGGDKNFHYHDKTFLYYKVGPESAIKIKKSKKKFFKMFDDKSDLIEEFTEENNLSFRKEEDLIEIFEYYNTLL
jgi:hypothetical protein